MTEHRAQSATGDLHRWATTREILAQPDIWRDFAAKIDGIAQDIQSWLGSRVHDEIWFCGAGTSAFIGDTLSAYLNRAAGPARYRAIPTTDLVSCPRNYIRSGLRPLVISFGRSGNSSETIGALDLLDAHMPAADRLHITCNGDSALARREAPGPGETRTIVLPPETNDQGFAMTSSYTTMLLTALACLDRQAPAPVPVIFARLANAAEKVIDASFERFGESDIPERAVFLGAGPLTGAARECALKVLELTGGRVATSWDSTLGFRHGPKAIVNDKTSVYVLQSGDAHTRAYDSDLAAEIVAQYGADKVVRLGETATGASVDVPIIGNDAWTSVLHVLVAQVLAVIWSDRLGLPVDDPFAGQNLTRVVTGVKLYPLPKAAPKLFGAIDLGGSKIEACLFDDRLEPVSKHRVTTPKQPYEALVAAILGEADWLRKAGGDDLPIGIGIPGLIDPRTGRSTTANLPATGRRLSADLSARLGRSVPVENDCKCFALSEANGGAGAGHRTVFGLILGTGLGGGVCVDGKLVAGLNGLPGEVGHFGLPAQIVARHGLPLVACGCGRTGCYETLVSGPGMSRLALHLTGSEANPEEIVAAAAGDVSHAAVYAVWLDLLAELLHTIQLTVDADCIVLGGGLSQIDGLTGRLLAILEEHKLPGVRSPAIVTAKYGDASGVRGAALLARQAAEGMFVA